MELLNGISLEQFVKTFGPMEPARAVYVLRQACHSLAEAHARGLVHRDIKPANIHLGRLGLRHDVVKVLDFGLVKAVDTGQTVSIETAAGIIPGTPAYIAPEVALAQQIDGRADLYSLGVTFYAMLTGTLPFRAKDPVEWVYCHIAQTPPPPHAIVPSIPPQLSAVVLKLLAKAAEERYQSARGLRHDLAECFSRWRTSGVIPPFALGQRDRGGGRVRCKAEIDAL